MKKPNRVLAYLKENPSCYLAVVIGYSIVGILEFFGLSSLVPAFAILIGETFSGIPAPVVKYVNELGPTNVFILYVLLVVLQMVVALLSERFFIKVIGEWRTSFIISYVRKVINAEFQYSSIVRPGEMEVVITRNVQVSVKNRFQVATFITDLVLASFYLATALFLSLHVLILFAMLFLLYLFVNRRMIGIRMQNFAEAKESYFQAASLTSEYVRDLRSLLSSNVDVFLSRVEKKAREAAKKQEVNDMINNYLKVTQTPLLIVMIGVWVYLCKAYFEIPNAKIIIILLVFYRCAPRAIAVLRGYSDILESSVSDVREDEIYWDARQNIGTQIMPAAEYPAVYSLQGVQLAYAGKTILSEVNLEIRKHDFIGIVGASGSGKSTLLDLFCGFLRPSTGIYRVNGIDVSQANILEWVQKNVAILKPESTLISGSVYENVAFLEENPDLQKVDKLLAAVELADLFRENKRVEKAGANLSAGQRQRLLLARALYKDIKVLVLDEPTSNLDVTTEKIINELILSLKGKITVLIATHRFELLDKCDQVFKLEAGQVNVIR